MKRRAPAPKHSGPRPPSLPGEDRIQKILAHAGVGSRRACEELILQGRVTVDGQVVRELGTKVDPRKMTVALDGQKVQLERPVYFAVFKPKGYVSTNNDPSGRPRVLDLLPEIPQRVYTVGRLDEMSMGLMLLTNDGELANKLAHPRFGVEKLYRVIVAGIPTREVLKQLTDGIWLAEGKVRAKSVRAVARKGEATILEMVLAEGKNREVRRMLAKLGHKVMLLTRVAVGPITVKGLTAGQFRPLTGREVDLLRRVAAGEPVPMPWMSDRKSSRPMTDRPRRATSEGPRGNDRPAAADSRREGYQGPPRRPEGRRDASPPAPGRRPEGPGGFRAASNEPPRRPGPRPAQDGPARQMGGHARSESRQGPHARPPGGYRQGPGGPPRRPEGPGSRPPRPDDRPQAGGRPGVGRRPEPMEGGPPPRPPMRTNGGPSSRPPMRGNGGPPPRPPMRTNGRPSTQRPAEERRPGPRPPLQGRRPGPSSGEPPLRKVIGMESEAAPTPPRDDRPGPRPPKRPAGKRPAPRPAPGLKPRRRPGGPAE